MLACLILMAHVLNPRISACRMIAAHQFHLAHVRHMEHMAHLAWISEMRKEIPENDPILSPGPSRVASGNVSYVPVASLADNAGHGDFSCSGLASLWIQAGGNPAYQGIAASIAMAESGGNPNAVSPTDDIGLWQVNRPSWPSLATFSPVGSARAAVSISANGTNWNPWTTYTSGAYYGRC